MQLWIASMTELETTPLGKPLPPDWRLEPLGPMCSKIGSGATPRGGSAVYKATGTTFIRSQNVFDHHFSRSGLAFIDDDSATKLDGVSVQPNDILLNITGDGETIARCCVVPKEVLPARVNQHVMIIRPGDQLVPGYLQRYLSHPRIRQYMLSHNSGGSRRALTKSHVEGFRVVLPPLSVQRAIDEVLGALDEKIVSNQKLVEDSDALWLALASSALDQIEEHAESLPGGELQNFSSIARFVNGRAFTKNATGSGRMVIRIAELNNGPGASTVYNDIDVATDYLAHAGDLLFAWSGSLTVQRWFRDEAIINQHLFKVIPNPNIPSWFVHAHLLRLLPMYQRIASGKATTMGHIQRRDLDVVVGVPKVESLAKLDLVCDPLWRRSLQAELETVSLVNLRDTLLPRLLSGDIRVREINALVEDAV